MTETNSVPLRIFVVGADTELGGEVIQQLIQRGHHLTAQVKNAQPVKMTPTFLQTLERLQYSTLFTNLPF